MGEIAPYNMPPPQPDTDLTMTESMPSPRIEHPEADRERIGSADAPPVEPGPFRAPELVEILKSEAGPRLDVRYASADNFLGRAAYREARVFLQRPAAEALLRAHRRLKPLGLGLLLFDGYRPWSVTKLFWDSVEGEKRLFVANPAEGSKHNRGCTVDLSLYHLDTGLECELPSAFDEMNEKAYPDYQGGRAEARGLRDTLRRAMEAEGFSVHPREWWHFDYRDWPEYAILDWPFERLFEAGLRVSSYP